MSTYNMAFVGDVMSGDSFYAIGNGVASSLDKYGMDFLPKGIVNLFLEHKLVFCNVECVLSDIGRKDFCLRTIHMRGRPETARYLAEWGINVVNLANNHILEQSFDAAVDTVSHLQNAGIKTTGAGREGIFQSGVQVAKIDCGGQEVSVLGACFLEEKYAFNGCDNRSEIMDTIDSLIHENRVVVVSMHCGDELMDRPSIWQKRIAREFINSGASLVIGHHPHVVQGVEEFKGGLIAYSLGNFIFDSFIEDSKWSMILSVKMSGRKIVKWECIPVYIDKEHRPQLATGDRKTKLEKEIQRRCTLLESEIPDDYYQNRYDLDFKSHNGHARAKLYFELMKIFLCCKPIYWPQILWRPVQRRLKKW